MNADSHLKCLVHLGCAAGLALPAVSLNSGCSATGIPEKGALYGAGAGAAIGAVATGSDRGANAAKGALIGGLLGATAGLIVEAQAKPYSPPPQYPGGPPGPTPPPEQFPVATPTNNPNEVISPHPPNNIINVQGYRRGEIVVDPTTDKPFRIP